MHALFSAFTYLVERGVQINLFLDLISLSFGSLLSDLLPTLRFITWGILKWLNTISIYVPWQDSPFPEKPLLQVQPNEPIVFVHVALPWQLPVPSSHSLISARFKDANWLQTFLLA